MFSLWHLAKGTWFLARNCRIAWINLHVVVIDFCLPKYFCGFHDSRSWTRYHDVVHNNENISLMPSYTVLKIHSLLGQTIHKTTCSWVRELGQWRQKHMELRVTPHKHPYRHRHVRDLSRPKDDKIPYFCKNFFQSWTRCAADGNENVARTTTQLFALRRATVIRTLPLIWQFDRHNVR